MMRVLLSLTIAAIGSCQVIPPSPKMHYVNDSEGYISFYIEVDQGKLEKLRDNLARNKSDTCFVYYNMQVFKDKTLRYDSISYQCNNYTRLDKKILNNFGRTLKPKVLDTSSIFLAFEPYKCVLQISLEVGKNQRDDVNRIFLGYSKYFKFKDMD